MDLPVDVDVKCSDGLCGRSTYIVLNPASDRVTHLVVQERSFPNIERLVKINQIIHSDSGHIHLRCSKEEFSQMEPFIESDFLPSDMYDMEETPYLIWPYSVPESVNILLEYEHIPVNELAVQRGAGIYASDDYIGKLDEFLIDPTNEQITHLIIREGHLWNRRDITIPISEVDRIEEDGVFLKLSKDDIEKLPTIPLRRKIFEWKNGSSKRL